MHTPRETSDKIKIKRNTFSLASDNDAEESMFFESKVKKFLSIILKPSQFQNT